MNHIKDCELGDNWKECPACLTVAEATRRSSRALNREYWRLVGRGTALLRQNPGGGGRVEKPPGSK